MNKKGFTLIEMLVVVAIIGILAAAVLVALGPSRDKARDSRIISAVNQARAVMETLYNPTTAVYPAAADALTNESISAAQQDAENNGATGWTLISSGADDQFSVSAALKTKVNGNTVYWCADATGFAGQITAAESTSKCTRP